ncbi:TonB-dependent receptor [Desertivirga arenae]|uniref:TonB-dependent receptor n=1 Tax=Desertivirga arenae TaxID=2810309 RepID=UPI001A963CD6|nr:TonB-dependent receptor [Pedobacter sp. SYSU D00823]
MRSLFLFCLILTSFNVFAQSGMIHGKVTANKNLLPFVSIKNGNRQVAVTDSNGYYMINELTEGTYSLNITAVGFEDAGRTIKLANNDTLIVDFDLKTASKQLREVVISGTMKEVNRLDSPVPVEVYSPAFFKKNPTACIFDALQNVNGVRPQVNCNICNTGDIHINGLEGPYTMVTIDGMPIVSSLSTVYGLSGIPNSLIDRIEIVKGPASSLYGSEAVGGLINIITKKTGSAPNFSADVFSTTWGELNTDLGFKLTSGKSAFLTGLNYFNYKNPIDNNNDRFTDVTQQHRISVFEKWSLQRKENRLFSLAGRYFYEDRWGGQMSWNRNYRGGSVFYGESIYTSRWELLGNYQLPLKERMVYSFSYNDHHQNSAYGVTPFVATQRIAFNQLTWDKKLTNHDLLLGTALRYTYYTDNTTASRGAGNQAKNVWLPGIFIQDDISINPKHNILLGLRYDYNSNHGNILTPRLAWKWKMDDYNVFRLNAGTGFRVVNIFTEDHAALTGAREVVILDDLKPEKSYNLNLNFNTTIARESYSPANLELSAWYTYFNNRIVADYETDVNKIIYDNLRGYAISKGISANLDLTFANAIKLITGFTLMDVSTVNNVATNKIRERQLLTEPWMGTWALTIPIKKNKLSFDYTGNIYGPMKLPLMENDPRPAKSPVWSLQNVQLTYNFRKLELYGGLKNLLNFTPNKGLPYLIAGADKPFEDGFDPTYVYAPNQGIRGFLGVRMNVMK